MIIENFNEKEFCFIWNIFVSIRQYVETQKKFTWVSLVKQNDYDRRNKGSKYQSWESG